MILTINPGSSSIKCALFNEHLTELHHLEINTAGPIPKLSCDEKNEQELCQMDISHTFTTILNTFEMAGHLIHQHQLQYIAIRVVHGGTYFTEPTEITKENFSKLEEVSRLAPLHNPPALHIIEEILSLPSHPKIFACFDTAFHQTIPKFIAEYALPRAYETKFGIRKYGFHGLSCSSMLRELSTYHEGNLPSRIIICHLGSGASITAVKDGKSFDTSMGLTPLEGIVMRTRGGDMDPGVILELFRHAPQDLPLSKAITFVEDILNKESGLKALTGGISDMRIIIEQAEKGNEFCILAIDSFTYHVRKYIGSYVATLGGCDAIIFTGGIGEGSTIIREKILSPLRHLGIEINTTENAIFPVSGAIHTQESSVGVYVFPANESYEMARQVEELL